MGNYEDRRRAAERDLAATDARLQAALARIQRAGHGSVSIQAGRDLYVNGERFRSGDVHDVYLDDSGSFFFRPSGTDCKRGGRHLTTVTTGREWWRPWKLLYYVRCFSCNLKAGPRLTKKAALDLGKRIEDGAGAPTS